MYPAYVQGMIRLEVNVSNELAIQIRDRSLDDRSTAGGFKRWDGDERILPRVRRRGKLPLQEPVVLCDLT